MAPFFVAFFLQKTDTWAVMKKLTPPENEPYVMLGTSAGVPDLLYATGFDAPDPVAAVRWPDGRTQLLVGRMEYGRAARQARGCEVASADTLGLPAGAASPEALLAAVVARSGAESAWASASFPLGAALALEKAGVRVRVTPRGPLADARTVKTPDELRRIRAAQRAARAAERALGAAIRTAEVGPGGALWRDGRPFTSERARALVRETLLSRGAMDFEGSIVAGGRQAADPHEAGRGALRAGEWIVADVFPRMLATGYWGDMTRTFAHGRPDAARRRMYETVARAQRLALSLVRPGALGRDVHRAVADFFVREGWETGTDADGRAHGFFHGLGHGVGLEIHEEPRLSPSGGELAPGMVVSVEPGLYYPELGGVRIEDLVVVTETGCAVL